MQAISLKRSALAQTAVASLATFSALVILGLVLAHWTWIWFAPHPEPRAQTAVQTDRGAVGAAVYGLFGSARRDNGAAPAGIAIRLLGVAAATGGSSGTRSGYAVLRLDANQIVAVREGAEIESGIRLAEVHADHIVLERGGTRETLAWPEAAKSPTASAPRAGN